MGRLKKSSATFRLDITAFIALLGNDGEQRVRDAYRKYKSLLELQRRKKKKKESLASDQYLFLENDAFHANYLLGVKLVSLEKKLRTAEQREASEAAKVTAAEVYAADNATDSSAIEVTASKVTTIVVTAAETTAENAAIEIAAAKNTTAEKVETNTSFVLPDSPSIPQCSPSTQRVRCNRNKNDSARNFTEGMSFDKPGCHCVPPKPMESRRKETEDGKRSLGYTLNGINYNPTNQNNEKSSGQSNENGGMSLQSENHNIIIEKCNVFEDGSCHVCSNKLATGVAIRVDDSQSRDMEYAPECPVWHCLGCWEPTSLLITQLFQHTYDYHIFLCRFAINIKNAISGWLILECRDRLHVISRIFEQNLSTATVTMDDIACFFSCGSADCHDCSTPGLERRNRSDDANEVGEMPMQIDHDLESQINSWVDDDDMHDDDQSAVHSTVKHGKDQSSVQVSNQTSTQDHTLAHENSGSMRRCTSTTGRTTTERLSLPPHNSGPHTRSQARGQYCQTTSNR